MKADVDHRWIDSWVKYLEDLPHKYTLSTLEEYLSILTGRMLRGISTENEKTVAKLVSNKLEELKEKQKHEQLREKQQPLP